jgi:flagellar export protein FliJ
MRRFDFDLEKVLELRRYAEREWELKLAEVTGRIVGAEREVVQLQSARDSVFTAGVEPGRVDMGALAGRGEYLALIERRTVELRGRLARLEREREDVRSEFLKASRARKAISQLRDRRAAEHYKEARREEAREFDEMGVTLAVQRIREERDV